MQHHRRKVVGVLIVVSLVTLGLTLDGVLRPASAQQPITISILDNGGDLASTGVIIENYKKANPNKVKEIKIQRGPAPETPAKIKAQQDAGRADINLILTGQDAGSVLAANNQLIRLFPTYDKMFPRDGHAAGDPRPTRQRLRGGLHGVPELLPDPGRGPRAGPGCGGRGQRHEDPGQDPAHLRSQRICGGRHPSG